MTDVVGSSVWKVGVDTSTVDKSLSSTAQKSKELGAEVDKTFNGPGAAGVGKFGGFVDSLKGKLGGLGAQLKSPELGKGLLQGVGLGAGLLAFGGITEVIKGAGDMLGELAKAGKEAQVTEAKLDAALKANVPDWQAHTQEIEAAARAGEKLGFTDNQVKDSLASLVLHTHDVTKAIAVQRVAMDLARLKGIDLATASLALGRAWDGSTTALKKMGIEVDKGAKGFDAINSVEKAAAGQATAYSQTAQGAQDALNASIEGFKEKLGTFMVKPLTELMNFIGGPVLDGLQAFITSIGNVGTAFDNLHRFIDPTYAATEDLTASVVAQANQLGLATDKIDAYVAAQQKNIQAQYAVAIAHAKTTQEISNLEQQEQQALNDTAGIRQKAFEAMVQDQSETMRLSGQNTLFMQNEADQNAKLAQARADSARQLYLSKHGIQDTLPFVTDLANTIQDVTTKTGLMTIADNIANAATNRSTVAQAHYGGALGASSVALDKATQKTAAAGAAFHHVGDEFAFSAKDTANQVVAAFNFMGTGVVGALKQADKDAKSEVNQLWYDIRHPGELDKNRNALKHQMDRAQKALHAAEKTGDANVIQEAQQLVDDLNQKWQQLNGTITIHANVDAYNQSSHALLQGGRASGGPIWPGDWIVGEHGPERMRITRGDTGYVWPNAGGGPGTPAVQEHRVTFGPLTINAPNMSPAAAGELGRGIGDRLSGVLVELKRMSTQPIGAGAG